MRSSWKEGDPWPPVQSDSEEEEEVETEVVEREAEEEEEEAEEEAEEVKVKTMGKRKPKEGRYLLLLKSYINLFLTCIDENNESKFLILKRLRNHYHTM